LILYVNGDSHSRGHDAGGINFSYGKHLADSLDATLVCAAHSGCSNARIIRTTNEYLLDTTPDFIIIGWSTWERAEWFYKDKYYNVNSAGSDILPEGLVQQYKTWVIEEAPKYVEHDINSHQRIWEFHLSLNERKIPHLFFNCFTHFAHASEKFDWGNSYIEPYSKEFTYYHWLENQGYKPSNPKYYHYGADAHIAWADFLLPHLTNTLKESIIVK
jgi:hypothetical protein